MKNFQFFSNCTGDTIRFAAEALKSGNLVAFPTETVYGLGADARNSEAVKRVYEVKGRPTDHPLIVHISSINQLDKWAIDVPEYAIDLARKFWPGPMTLILKRSQIVGNFVTPASNSPIASTAGVQQLGTLLIGCETTNATATVLRSNTSAAGTTNQVILPNNSAYTFQGTCIANVTAGGTTSGWKFEGVIKRGANAASTALVAAVTPTVIAQDAGASTWVLAITADTTNGGIAVTVTGAAATTIRWVAKIETTEVTF